MNWTVKKLDAFYVKHMSTYTVVVGLLVLVTLAFVSLPALAIVLSGSLLMWLLHGSVGSSSCSSDSNPYVRLDVEAVDDDTLSVDSGVHSAKDFTSTAKKGTATQPPQVDKPRTHSAPPTHIAIADEYKGALYESRDDQKRAEMQADMSSSTRQMDLSCYYKDGLPKLIQSLRKELRLNDPNLVPLNKTEPIGCPRPLGKI